MRADLGLGESGLDAVIRGAFSLLDADRVLHRRRGQAGAVVAPPSRAVGVARGRPDPLRHPARLRPRRGRPWDELVDAGGYAGARDRGTLRLEGRDYVVTDGDVITVEFTPVTRRGQRSARLSACSRRPASAPRPNGSPRPWRRPRDRLARPVDAATRRCATWRCREGAQLVGADSRQRRGDPRALAGRAGDRRLERAVAPEQLGRGLGPDSGRSREAVGGVAAQRDEVRHELPAESRSDARPRPGRAPRTP